MDVCMHEMPVIIKKQPEPPAEEVGQIHQKKHYGHHPEEQKD
jgi:hypothetical protein